MSVVILNNSCHANELLISIVSHVLPKGVFDCTIEFSDIWFSEDEEGIRTFDPNVMWDGCAWGPPRREVWVILSPVNEFPCVWWVNGALEGKYVRGMCFRDATEFLVYCAAHELRHLWQWRYPRAKLLGAEFGGDDETDADLYAIMKLWQWRMLDSEITKDK